jgi:two-component system sensor histidine kinase HydH
MTDAPPSRAEPGPLPSTQRARWGLLIVTLVMGAALVVTSAAEYLGALRYSRMAAVAEAVPWARAVARDLPLDPEEMQGTLDSIMEELSLRGLRFVGLADQEGAFRYSTGRPAAAPLELPERGPRGMPPPRSVGERGRLRIVFPPGRRFGAHRRLMQQGDSHDSWRHLFLVIEYESRTAQAIRKGALTTLVVSLAAAALLLVAAAVFWRLSRRADATEVQLAKDRQLKALGQMSAVLGHELRNPLASLKGNAQLLLESVPEDHAARPGAELVVGEAVRLEMLANQVLDFARTGEVDRSPGDPLAMVRAAVEGSGAGPVEVDAEGEIPAWPLDRPRMEQVLRNLLDNARAVSGEDEAVQLSVRVPGDRLEIAVRDRGEGIEPGEEEKVFEPFFTRRVRGTGLGLALARRIVEGHGGRITVVNHPEGGAEFRIALPRE